MNQPEIPVPAPSGRPSPFSSPPPPPPPAGFAPPRRANSGWLLAVAILLAAIAAGLGYYSVELWRDQRKAQAELLSTKQTVGELQHERTQSEQRDKAREEKLEALQKELGETKASLGEAQTKLEALAEQQADADALMRDYKAIAARFQRLIDSGRLKINYRRGRMVVDLPAKVLFPSGSAELSKEGQQDLRDVARILRKVKGKRFIVAGHTDNVKIKQKRELYSSNWALSAARAVTVTEALVRAGMLPAHLVAAGYGPHDPVASNQREAGRQQNRRIEIILEPKLRELPDRLEEKL